MKTFLLMLLISINSISFAQLIDWNLFGDSLPETEPKVFAPGLISTDAFEFYICFSSKGDELFFTRRESHGGSNNRIYTSKFIDGKWKEPQLADFSEDVFEFEAFISPKGDQLIFYSERIGERLAGIIGDLWLVEKNSDKWGEPMHFNSTVNRKWIMSVSIAQNGNLYFSGNIDGRRGVYTSGIHDHYSTLQYLSDTVNKYVFFHPFIAPDETYLILDRQKERGKSELFICFKNEEGNWTSPVNLGEKINATKTEFGGSVSPDGKYLFFHRRINGNGEIMWVSMDEILK